MQNFTKRLEGKTHLIWDWNGTILNDVSICHAVLCEILQDHGYPTLSLDEYRAKFCFPIKHFYTEVLSLNISHDVFEAMSIRFTQRYGERVQECQVFEGLLETMAGLKEQDIHHSVLSAAYEPHLHEQLAKYQVQPLLTHAFGISDIHAAGKVERAHQLISLIDHPKEEMLLIGDTAHDLEVADSIGIDCLLVADGHYAPERLHSVHTNVMESRFL